MSSSTSQADLWLERSRLDGMLLGAVSYGAFIVLTIQGVIVLMRQPRSRADKRLWFISYILITFVLGTIGFASNAKFTEMIWIDLRDAPGGPVALIKNESHYSINILAIVCYYIMEWFMQAMLLYRCFVIWNWSRYVVIPMIPLLVAMIAMTILVLIQASIGVTWYNINTAYLPQHPRGHQCDLYHPEVLVTNRLLVMRSQMKRIIDGYDSSIYDSVVWMTVESAMLYSVLSIVFLVSFAVHSYVSNLCFPSIGHVQGISQLLIIVRAVRGHGVTRSWSIQVTTAPTSIAFTRAASALGATNGADVEQINLSEQNGAQLYSLHSTKAEEV